MHVRAGTNKDGVCLERKHNIPLPTSRFPLFLIGSGFCSSQRHSLEHPPDRALELELERSTQLADLPEQSTELTCLANQTS